MSVSLAYRHMLAVAGVTLFFTGISDFVFVAGLTSVPPLYSLVALAVMALPLLWTPFTLRRALESPVILWGGFYAAFSCLAFMWSSQSGVAWAELRWRILAVLFLSTSVLIFADPQVHRTARLAILCSVFLGAVLNVLDLARPLTFSPIVGRAAGLYVNPNLSAIALVLGMIMSVELVPQRLRPWFMGFVGTGVLLTFSRGGAAAWVVATTLVVALGGIQIGSMLRVATAGALVLVGALVIAGWWETALQMTSVVSSDAWGRLRLGTEMMDVGAEVRLGGARVAWQMFLERPVFGWGVGATAEWDWYESTHNIYLRHLAEYGFAGLAIVPLLVWAVLWRGTAAPSPVAVWLAGVILVWGIFSHNLLDERHFLICVALVAALAHESRNREVTETALTPAARSAS